MEKAEVAVMVVPLPVQSHLNQLLRLASLISSYNLPVHYLGSATHNRQANLRYGPNPNPVAQIHFHDLPTPPIPAPYPSTGSDKIPVHIQPAISAYMELRRPIGALVREMSTKTRKIVVIYDRFIAEAVSDAVSIPNVESYAFNCVSGFNLFYILWQVIGKPFDLGGPDEKLFSFKDFYPEETMKFMASRPEHFSNRAGDIHNTIRCVEGKYVDLLARREIGGKTQQWAISPTLVPEFSTGHDTGTRHECMDWLDGQAPGSVIYVSFGTIISLSGEEISEIASGLEQSKLKFIWVIRDADRADIFSGGNKKIELPDGFEERARENGILVVRDWAPQMEILAHRSTGGFMSHCGWNSCLESLITGVPMLAWPMHSDQPLNAIFVTGVWKTGLFVMEWEKREEIVRASVIKDAVERLMGSEEGHEIRKKAGEMRAAVGKAAVEGGEYWRELESFVAHISR
ncbi:hypothetical protein OROMI_028372 [Orobanche minor]